MIRYIMILTALMILAGCGQKDSATHDDGKLDIVATTGMITDIVQKVGGDQVVVYGMMGPGVDPHLYKATKGDMDNLDKADMVFYNGLHLEAKLTDVLEMMGRNKTTVAVSREVPDSLLRFPKGFEGHPDPHIWFDLSLWERAVNTVGEALAEKDPANAEQYQQRAQALADSVSQLHDWITAEIATIPKDKRVLVTAHDAFGYFGRAYDIEVEGLQGISTVTEAGLYDVTQMVDMLTERGISAVFVESSVPRKAIEAVVDGCHDKGHALEIGGELYSDAMGEIGSPTGNYLGMVKYNVTTIVNALK